MEPARSNLRPNTQDDSTAETLFFFPQYSSSNDTLKRVLRVLITIQILNFSCILAVVTMAATTINLSNTINNSILQKDIEPYTTGLRGILVIAAVSFSVLPLRVVMWKHGTQSKSVIRFRLFTIIVFSVSIIIWSLAVVVLLMNNLPDYMCRTGVHKGKALNEGCCVHAMRVCALNLLSQTCCTNAQSGWDSHLCMYYSLLGAHRVVYMLRIYWAFVVGTSVLGHLGINNGYYVLVLIDGSGEQK